MTPHTSNETLARDEDGQLIQVADFDYSKVDNEDEAEHALSEFERMTPAQVENALKVFRALVRWLWQDAMKNPDGLKIRAVIVCWIFLEELQQHSLTDIAGRFFQYKQSFGRWVDVFKKDFPYIRTKNMKP